MATLNSRITELENKSNRFQDMRYMTNEELLDICGLPHDATIEQIQAIKVRGEINHE
jgi:hypothetical protein